MWILWYSMAPELRCLFAGIAFLSFRYIPTVSNQSLQNVVLCGDRLTFWCLPKLFEEISCGDGNTLRLVAQQSIQVHINSLAHGASSVYCYDSVRCDHDDKLLLRQTAKLPVLRAGTGSNGVPHSHLSPWPGAPSFVNQPAGPSGFCRPEHFLIVATYGFRFPRPGPMYR